MRKFGLIGKTLSHSFSSRYFADKFKNESIADSEYLLFEIAKAADIPDFLNSQDFQGLNVTIPYKEAVLPFLDEIDPIAQKIGAVNTIAFDKGKRIGYNTDYLGFQKSIRPFLAIEHKRALILGTGGASKAIAYFLESMDIPYFFCSRKVSTEQQVISYSDLSEEVIQQFQLLINTSPVGSFPNSAARPAIPMQGIGANHLVYDLIYNPEETELLKQAKAQGALTCNGLNMLKIQAEESWKIWNS